MLTTIECFDAFKRKFLSQLPKNYKDLDNDLCWVWAGSIDGAGYGRFFWNNKLYQATRISYALFNGDITKYRVVRPSCNNSECVNPKHLVLGTQKENMIDAVKCGHRPQSTKLNEEAVKVIKWMLKYKKKYGLVSKLAILHGVTTQTIKDIGRNKTWTWVEV